MLLFPRSVSSKHGPAFIHAVRNKPLGSSASCRQQKRLRKLRFARRIWGEEAKPPRGRQPPLRDTSPCNRGVAAANQTASPRGAAPAAARPDGPDPQVSDPALSRHKSPGPITASPAFKGTQCFAFQTAYCRALCKSRGRMPSKRNNRP